MLHSEPFITDCFFIRPFCQSLLDSRGAIEHHWDAFKGLNDYPRSFIFLTPCGSQLTTPCFDCAISSLVTAQAGVCVIAVARSGPQRRCRVRSTACHPPPASARPGPARYGRLAYYVGQPQNADTGLRLYGNQAAWQACQLARPGQLLRGYDGNGNCIDWNVGTVTTEGRKSCFGFNFARWRLVSSSFQHRSVDKY